MGCYHPITVKHKTYGTLRAPCGGCEGCRKQRSADWCFRLLQEMQNHQLSLFTTLTYSDENIKSSPDGQVTLNKRDLQLFFKKLRKHNRSPVKYYACGEYGGTTCRPHYHAILFGATPTAVSNAWDLGHSYNGEVNIKTIQYVTGYIIKPKLVGFNPGDDRQREFSHMSKKLGLSYLTDEIRAYHENGLKSFVTLEGGQKQRLPRYYRDKIFTDAEKEQINSLSETKSENKLREIIQQQGSFVEYERNRIEAIKAQTLNFQTQHNNLRTTL